MAKYTIDIPYIFGGDEETLVLFAVPLPNTHREETYEELLADRPRIKPSDLKAPVEFEHNGSKLVPVYEAGIFLATREEE